MEYDALKIYVSQRLANLATIPVTNKKPITSPPYIIYKFTACGYNVRHRKDWILELDYWDNKDDDTDIIQQSIYIKNGREDYIGLNNSMQNEDDGFYISTIEFESPIIEIESGISHYNQRFLLKVD